MSPQWPHRKSRHPVPTRTWDLIFACFVYTIPSADPTASKRNKLVRQAVERARYYFPSWPDTRQLFFPECLAETDTMRKSKRPQLKLRAKRMATNFCCHPNFFSVSLCSWRVMMTTILAASLVLQWTSGAISVAGARPRTPPLLAFLQSIVEEQDARWCRWPFTS